MLVNPFTGIIINAWSDEARKASAESRRKRADIRKSNLAKSYNAIQKSAGKARIIYSRAPEKFYNLQKKPKIWGVNVPSQIEYAMSVGLSKKEAKELLPKPKPPKIYVGKNARMERAIAAHEVGHRKLGHIGNLIGLPDEEIRQEKDAWKWAMKNRKKLRVSKKKLFQLIRTAEARSGLKAGTLFNLGKSFIKAL